MIEYLLLEIGIVIISAAILGVILHYLKQPLVLAYILAGILIGPLGFGLITDPHFVHGISAIGIMLMLFLVGLEMSTSRLRDLGIVALVAGIGQVIFTGSIGFVIVKLFGFTTIQSIYLAVALTFSSTVIAVKLMSDKRDTHSFYGQICIGILIVQDILAIIALLLLAGFKEGSFAFDYAHFGGIFLKGAILATATVLISKHVLKYVYSRIANSHELLILFSLSWCFLISLLSMKIGFSMEIGAFIAGLSLANLPYTFEINAKSKVLRDFFITIFFAALGTGMVFGSVGTLVVPLIVLSLFVLIGNPIIVLVLMGRLGYDKRTAFFTGLNIANISEFSLIVIALGNKLGHLGEKVTSMVAIITVVTMVISSYMITYNRQLYKFFKKYLSIFEARQKKDITAKKKAFSNHIILLGCGHIGEQVLGQILSFKDDYVVIDHDNEVIKKLMSENINCLFGDIEDDELLEELDLEDAEIVISTLPHAEDNYFLLRYLSKMKKDDRPFVIAVADSGREGLEMSEQGVDYVILKPYLSAHHIHRINEEIYQIRKRLKHTSVSVSQKGRDHTSDYKLAKTVGSLNDFKLKEIIEKIGRKEVTVVSKK